MVESLNRQNTHTRWTGLQLGRGDCQLSALGLWQDVQLQTPGMRREGGRGGWSDRGRGK